MCAEATAETLQTAAEACAPACLTALACVHTTYFTCFFEWNLALDDPW